MSALAAFRFFRARPLRWLAASTLLFATQLASAQENEGRAIVTDELCKTHWTIDIDWLPYCRNQRLGERRALAEVVFGQHEPRRLERSHARKIVGQRRPVPQIDLGQRQPGEHRRRATVHEERIVDHDGHGQREQPATVSTLRSKRHLMPEVADRKARIEFGAGIRTVSCDPLGALLLAHPGGLFRGIGLELARCHVAHVTQQVHRFVVAECHVKLSARGGGLALQAHQ